MINQSIIKKASKITVTIVSVQDQQGAESAYSDPKTKPKYVKNTHNTNSDDYVLSTDAVPVISRFRRGCTCDVREFRCSRVFIAATGIYNSDSLTCRVQSANSQVNGQDFEVNMPL